MRICYTSKPTYCSWFLQQKIQHVVTSTAEMVLVCVAQATDCLLHSAQVHKLLLTMFQLWPLSSSVQQLQMSSREGTRGHAQLDHYGLYKEVNDPIIHYSIVYCISLPSDGENMVLMLDLKCLAQQSAVLPNLAEKNEILTIVLGCLAILHRHVNYLFVV